LHFSLAFCPVAFFPVAFYPDINRASHTGETGTCIGLAAPVRLFVYTKRGKLLISN